MWRKPSKQTLLQLPKEKFQTEDGRFDDGQFIIPWWEEGVRCLAVAGANIMHYIIIVITDPLVGVWGAEMTAQ